MQIIKLSTLWTHDYALQLPSTANYKFEINNSCQVADYWIIWGGLSQTTTVHCPKENVLYITDEAHEQRIYNRDFLNQFPTIASVRIDLEHFNNIYIHEPQIWYFDKTVDELINMKPFPKTETISMVVSDLTVLPGHKARFAMANKLIGHFKDKLHVYGRGFNPIHDKWQAIAPYKYSIAIENNVIPNYFTEKLTECFLSYTQPIYYGCPNISEYFDKESYELIDINDYKTTIHTIEKIIDEDNYDNNLAQLSVARNKFLTQLHVFPLLLSIIAKHGKPQGTKQSICVKPEYWYKQVEEYQSLIKTMGSQGLKLPLQILAYALKQYVNKIVK